MITFRVHGRSKLDEFSKMKWVDSAMHHIMIQARNEAKNHYCPVDTGMLRDSIYIRKIGRALYELGATMYYGVWHEYGSYNIKVGTVSNPNLIKTGYSPFLRPAIWKHIKKFPKLMKQYIEDIPSVKV